MLYDQVVEALVDDLHTTLTLVEMAGRNEDLPLGTIFNMKGWHW